jgi:hypothetical protein
MSPTWSSVRWSPRTLALLIVPLAFAASSSASDADAEPHRVQLAPHERGFVVSVGASPMLTWSPGDATIKRPYF